LSDKGPFSTFHHLQLCQSPCGLHDAENPAFRCTRQRNGRGRCNEMTCKRCYALDTCMLYCKVCLHFRRSSFSEHKYRLWRTLSTRTLQSQYYRFSQRILQETGRLNFLRLSRPCAVPTGAWTMGAAECEAKGRCFSSMVIGNLTIQSSSGNYVLSATLPRKPSYANGFHD
jgi:hypothetical protein